MTDRPQTIFAGFDEPQLLPVITTEIMKYGWRGLTLDGEVLEVRSTNGHKAQIPPAISVTFGGRYLGQREVTNERKINIDEYLTHFNAAVAAYKLDNLQ